MDGRSVAIAAATAIGKLPAGIRPTIQSDHGSCYIAREFAQTLDAMDVGHHLIRPHTPTDNAEIERCNRTIGEKIDEALEVLETADFAAAEAVIDGVIDHYNHHRLHSSLNYLRPVDYYRGDPEPLLAERRRKLKTARELRKQENLKLRQKRLPYQAEEIILNSERQFVSL
ncbi:MAG: transposase [Planctomycetia bacterium]|nr:transposase [Planctomycetia bacterium]